MKKYILILVSIVIYNFSFSQDTIYFDASWKKIDKVKNAIYFRVVEEDKEQGKVFIKDYFMTGEIQMAGTYKTIAQKDKDGIFTWYHMNGNKKKEVEYKDGKYIKTINEWDGIGNIKKNIRKIVRDTISDRVILKEYHKNGKLFLTESYLTDSLKIKDGVAFAYFKNGNKKQQSTYSYNDLISVDKQWSEEGDEVEVKYDYIDIEKKPKFPGGIEGLQKYIAKNIEYPT